MVQNGLLLLFLRFIWQWLTDLDLALRGLGRRLWLELGVHLVDIGLVGLELVVLALWLLLQLEIHVLLWLFIS